MSIYITGDLHGNSCHEMDRLNTISFPQQKEMTKNDYVIIAGDFGFCFSAEGNKTENYWLNWLEERNFTTLFIDGNHENFDRLNNYPVSEWCGGKVQFLRPSVIHLMRGQVYNINGKIITTMGGAPSHDIQDGIFDPADYVDENDMWDAIRALEHRKGGWQFALYRIKGVNWWKQETPNLAEWQEWMYNLSKYDYNVDYIITHEAPASVIPFISIHKPTEMSKKLEQMRWKIEYKKWFFAHYHLDKIINDKEAVVYNNLIRVE